MISREELEGLWAPVYNDSGRLLAIFRNGIQAEAWASTAGSIHPKDTYKARLYESLELPKPRKTYTLCASDSDTSFTIPRLSFTIPGLTREQADSLRETCWSLGMAATISEDSDD